MARTQAAAGADLAQSLVESYSVNARTIQLVLEHLDPAAWRAKPPDSRVRTMATISSHLHNMRLKWLRLSAPQLRRPGQLHGARCSQDETIAALAKSAEACCEMIAGALDSQRKRPAMFLRDGWARPWPAGAAMVAYMISHEAHHRGQMCMLAHQLGFALPAKFAYKIWAWERLWKECGFTHPR